MSSAGGVRSPGPVQDWRGPGESRQMRHLSQSAILEEVGPPRLVRVILMLLSLTVFGFIGRSAVTELEETTKASGEVVLSGSVLSVQHLEGGVIKKISSAMAISSMPATRS
jgi:multidrug efflux pump subunit AcrA (membrane-fusion protein)